jgi:hypothetical protein
MRFLKKIAFLALVFVAPFVCSESKAQPFKINNPISGRPTTTAIQTNSCDTYNSNVSTRGAPLNGDHPTYCRFSIAQIGLNGIAFDDFWQRVLAGNVSPPYQVTYSTNGRQSCATATRLKFEVPTNIQTSQLDWRGAASVGAACLAEWNRHRPASFASAVPPAVIQKMEKLVGYLNNNVPNSFRSCATVGLPGQSVQRQAFVGLVTQIKQYISNAISQHPIAWSPPAVAGTQCMLHCNVCSSGWASTITLTKTYEFGNTKIFTETETYYVGGASSNPN